MNDPEDDEPKPKPRKKRIKKKPLLDEDFDDELDRPRNRKPRAEGTDILGPVKHVYGPNLGLLRFVTILCCTLTVAGLLSCLLSILFSMPNGTTVFTALSIPLGLAGLLFCMNYVTLSVAVHSGGIVHSHRGKTRMIPWEEIASVTLTSAEGNTGGTPVYNLDLRDLSKIALGDNIKDVEELGNTIVEKSSAFILPQVRLEYGTGTMVKFGRLGVSSRGLQYGKQVLDRREVHGVKSEGGFILVNVQGEWQKWCNIEVSTIPNVQVFVTFVNEIVKKAAW